MYSKCGKIHKDWKLFEKMHDANIISWNAIIRGYAIHDMHGNIMNNGEA